MISFWKSLSALRRRWPASACAEKALLLRLLGSASAPHLSNTKQMAVTQTSSFISEPAVGNKQRYFYLLYQLRLSLFIPAVQTAGHRSFQINSVKDNRVFIKPWTAKSVRDKRNWIRSGLFSYWETEDLSISLPKGIGVPEDLSATDHWHVQ